MPIRINLLAEAKAAEELRRNDPVKRVIFAGALAVALTLVWSSSLRLEAMLANKNVTDRQTEIAARTNEFQHVQTDQKKTADAKQKLGALKKMANSRFLQGNLLNALQQINVDGVRLTRLKVDQDYYYAAGTSSQTNRNGVILGRPSTVTEKVVVWLDARDSSANPGDQVNKFKEAVVDQSYFRAMLNKTNGVQLINLSPLQAGSDGKPCVLFTLKCNFPEYAR
jgi:alkanesulfonate monooxygenase SsuD/methylene tetrahydromethanopterin reductase-like flavin-dependent oxidoreductase (luciferase family)